MRLSADKCELYFFEHLDDDAMVVAPNEKRKILFSEMPTISPEPIYIKWEKLKKVMKNASVMSP